MTRTGKIGRLPEELQEQLNGRIGKKVPDAQLIQWLNDLPEVQAILARDFGGQKITTRNLALWKSGGYQQWLTETTALVHSVGRVIEAMAAKAPPEGESEGKLTNEHQI